MDDILLVHHLAAGSDFDRQAFELTGNGNTSNQLGPHTAIEEQENANAATRSVEKRSVFGNAHG